MTSNVLSFSDVQPLGRKSRFTEQINIEQFLHWVYQHQRADIVLARGDGLHPIERAVDSGKIRSMTTDSVLRVERTAEGTRSYIGAVTIHPDAETAHYVIMGMPVYPRDLLIRYGKSGQSPNWGDGVVTKLLPVLRANGKPEVVWSKNRNYQCYCKVEVVNYPEYIKALRDEYLTWWEGLVGLSDRLRSGSVSLLRFTVTAPLTNPAPWLGEKLNNTDRDRLYEIAIRKYGVNYMRAS